MKCYLCGVEEGTFLSKLETHASSKVDKDALLNVKVSVSAGSPEQAYLCVACFSVMLSALADKVWEVEQECGTP